MNEPLVSLIIPCYNGEKYLKEFLFSLINQDYSNVQVIFINDGSTDRTEQIYKFCESQFPKNWTSEYIFQPHKGQASAVSNGLEYVSGEFLMWSDADDIMIQGSIKRKAEFLMQNQEYNMVRNDFYFWYDSDKQEKLVVGYGKNKSKSDDIFEELFIGTMPCLAGTYMMRTKLLFNCYPNKKIPLSEEGQNFQLLLPPASRSKCGFLDQILMKYRIHSNSHSSQKRSTSQQFNRAKGFYKLRNILLDYCECDKQYYANLAKDIFDKQKKDIILNVVATTRKKTEEHINDRR